MTVAAETMAQVHWPFVRLGLAAVCLSALAAAGPSLHLAYGGWALMSIFAVSGLGILLALQIEHGPDQRGALIVILAGAVLMRLALLFTEPYLSTDIYRYVWDGRVQAAGIDPYQYPPAAKALVGLRDPALWPPSARWCVPPGQFAAGCDFHHDRHGRFRHRSL